MKNFTNNFKQFTSRLSARWLIMALMLLVGAGNAWAAKLYLTPGVWKTGNERFAAYFFGNGEKWVSMTAGPEDNMYQCDAPDGFPNVIFCRMNGSTTENNWNNKWNQTVDINNYSTQGNWATIGNSWCSGDNCKQSVSKWSTYTPTTPATLSLDDLPESMCIGETYDLVYSINPANAGTVTPSCTTGNATITGNTLTITGEGTVSVKVSASLNPGYTGGEAVTKSTTATYCPPTVNTKSAILNGNILTCKGEVTDMGSASAILWAFTILETDEVSKKDSEWEYPKNQNTLTTKGEFVYSIDVSEMTGTRYVRAMILDKSKTNYQNGEYIYAIADGAIEVQLCSSIPNNTYTIAGNNVWTGNENPVSINYDANTFAAPSSILYGRDAQVPTAVGTYAITIEVPAHNGYCASTISLGNYEITCIDIDEPAVEASSTICADTKVTLSDYNGTNSNTVKWYSNSECSTEVTQVTPTNGKAYYAKAYHEQSGCYSSGYSTLTFTVNAKPTIGSITQSVQSPVPFEDVVLTANNVTAGAEVKWYEDDVEKGEGLTYVVTSETATSKIVTAKAFLNGCESAVASHTVTFSAEVCNNVADMTKIYFDATENTGFVTGNNVYVTITKSTNGSADCNDTGGANQNNYVPKNDTWWGTMTKVAGENYIYEITIPNNVTINKGTTKLSFWNKSISSNSDVWEVQAILGQEISAGTNCMKLSNKTKTHNDDRHSHLYCGTWTTYANKPAISAPAVKTVSVTSDEDGNVTMVGQVVKTGCDTQAILGLQYKKQNPDGTTYEANYTTYPNPGTKEAISAGKTFTVTTKLEDGTYLVSARIDNSHATNGYGEDIKVVVNTTKTPISNVTLNYCDENGGSVGVDPNPMCKGATAYVKLEYAGSNYSDIKWLVEGVETNLVTDKGDGVWSYIIQGTGHLSVELRNDANKDNEDNPTWATSDKLSFTMKAEPAAPYISIDPASGIICEGSSATIKVENPSADCSYKLVEERSKAGFEPYKSGDLKYTVQNVGKYYVIARHNECTAYEYTSNQVAINQVIRRSAKISIEPTSAETTPWEKVSIKVIYDEGYGYDLTYPNGLDNVENVIIEQVGDTYTYSIPRPSTWGTGNANSGRTSIDYHINAKLKVDGEATQCQMSEANTTITLIDEENEVCN